MATRKKDAGFTFGSHASTDIPDYVVAELRHDSEVVVTPTQGIAAPARALNKVLAGFDLVRVVPQIWLERAGAGHARGCRDVAAGQRRC